MADPSETEPGASGSRARTGLPAWVWVAVLLAVVGAALASGWWVEQDRAAVPTEAPGQPEAFCNTVGDLQGQGDLNLTVGQQDTGLEPAIAGLRRLADADPPATVRDDLDQLADALDAVQDEARAATPGDPAALQQVGAVLQDRLRGLQGASDRIDAYTERWCGASLNPNPADG